MAECRSPSGQIYTVTEDSCTCPDHEHRWHVCRHMEGIRQLRGTTPDTDNTNQTTPPVISDIHDRAPELSELDTPEDRHRNQQLQIWQQYAPEPTVWMSRDDNAWQQLYQEAGGNLEYVYGGVLGGTDNTFGIEIEFEDGDAAAIGRELYSDGLLSSATRGGYHGVSRAGMWKFESDGSVTNGNFGGEIVSPVLVDSAETWRQLEHITEVVRRHGGHATDATGGHIHIGMDPLDDRAYRWQRLARIGMGYEKQLFRMGAADDEQFQRGSYGTHRGVSFTNPLPESARKLYGETLTADEARRLLVDYQHRGHGARYTMFNTTKYINNGVPTVEFRYPNGTLDARQIQAQVRVTNALLFQSASLRQDTAQGQLMPGLSQSQNQYRMNNHYTEQQETEGFRKFLDLIGNKDVQLAATWLWRRGRA